MAASNKVQALVEPCGDRCTTRRLAARPFSARTTMRRDYYLNPTSHTCCPITCVVYHHHFTVRSKRGYIYTTAYPPDFGETPFSGRGTRPCLGRSVHGRYPSVPMGHLPLRASALHGSVAHSPRHSSNQHIAKSASSRCWVQHKYKQCGRRRSALHFFPKRSKPNRRFRTYLL